AEIARRQPDIGEPHQVGDDTHFRPTELQPRPRANLVVLAARHLLLEDSHRIARDLQQLFELGPGYVELDDAGPAEAAAEQACLTRKAERSGLAEHGAPQYGHQLPGACTIGGRYADEGRKRPGDEPESVDANRAVGIDFFALFRPNRAHRIFDL